MKIAVIAPTYLPARRANTVQVMKMSQALTAIGHRVIVFVPGTSNQHSWETISDHYGLQHKFEVNWLPVKPALRSYDYGLKAVLGSRKWGADYIFTRLPQAAALGSLLGIPTIYEVHDIPQGKIGPRLFRRYLKGRGAVRLVVITQSLRDALSQQIGPCPPPPFLLVAPDGVDLQRYRNLPPPETARQQLQDGKLSNFPGNNFTVGYTGHLYPGRGISLILEIAAQLSETTFLLVGGDPSDIERVRGIVSERNLNNVILTGFIANRELPQYQAACDILLMPYQYKVAASSGGNIADYLSPMKLFEYLAVGRAIISSNLPVLQEVLTTENAVLLPPDDLQAWVTAITHLHDHPAARADMAQAAQKTAQNHSWESRARKILSFEV
jgi:glycosyltransferase involved in cell wall biosynthesis